MTEEFLYYVWQYQLFADDLQTEDGERIRVLSTGFRNTNSGPDFLEAQLLIGEIKWIGNIEIHMKASDWMRHGHDQDAVYDSIILHLVFDNDKPISQLIERKVPTLALGKYISKDIFKRYQEFKQKKERGFCEEIISAHTNSSVNGWMPYLVGERLQRKSERIKDLLSETNSSWEDTLYYLLSYYFGGSLNGMIFQQLARQTPLSLVAKMKGDPFRIEALYFGQAGLLSSSVSFEDDYPQRLQKEYLYLQKVYGLQFLDGNLWKFMRLRPYSFPTIRLSQWADLMTRTSHLFSQMLQCLAVKKLKEMCRSEASSYWNTHFLFDTPSANRKKKTGKSFLNNLVINAFSPMLFLYGREKKEAHYVQCAIDYLEQLPPEKNKISKQWADKGITASSALETQALIELKAEYCAHQRCLQCELGAQQIEANLLNKKR